MAVSASPCCTTVIYKHKHPDEDNMCHSISKTNIMQYVKESENIMIINITSSIVKEMHATYPWYVDGIEGLLSYSVVHVRDGDGHRL